MSRGEALIAHLIETAERKANKSQHRLAHPRLLVLRTGLAWKFHGLKIAGWSLPKHSSQLPSSEENEFLCLSSTIFYPLPHSDFSVWSALPTPANFCFCLPVSHRSSRYVRPWPVLIVLWPRSFLSLSFSSSTLVSLLLKTRFLRDGAGESAHDGGGKARPH